MKDQTARDEVLESELIKRWIYCTYTFAMPRSLGMNAVFHQLGFKYTINYIIDKIEDMNRWVKNLAEK
jgi:hypothetical protein